MTEEHAEDNLAAGAEAYLEQAVLRHPGEATKALKSHEELLPHAEELGIVGRCGAAWRPSEHVQAGDENR
uniref:Uncharacterized protein n=1 Tax=Oryza meridionalis TaxID=40149 RepID=A0A0E0DBF6_9ORYZ